MWEVSNLGAVATKSLIYTHYCTLADLPVLNSNSIGAYRLLDSQR
jgi:hypothetical protein